MRNKLLVIEDEQNISSVIKAYLEHEGYEVLLAADGVEGLSAFRKNLPDVVVLDLMLPYISGEQVLSEIRRISDVPVLILTAKSGENDVVGNLEKGADDYLSKPFRPKELVARVNAVLRRASKGKDTAKAVTGGLEVDLERKEARILGKHLKLTKNEYLILEKLVVNSGRAFTREELINITFGDDYDGFDRTVDTYIKNIRKKIAESGGRPEYIETVHGVGYRIGRLSDEDGA